MTMEQRFEQLARSNRRWRSVALGICLVAASGLLMAQGRVGAAPGVVQARRVEVINKKGVPVVILDAEERGGRIVTTSAQGDLYFETAAGAINIYNGRGQKLARLSATKDGQGMLATYNHNGEGVVALGATKDGKGAFTTYNGQGQKLVSLSANDSGGAVSVWNNTGQAISTMRADDRGYGEVGAWNHDGTGRKLTPGE